MNRPVRVLRRLAGLVLAALLCTPAFAAPPAGWAAVEPARLEGLRGGFVAPSGLVLSFGLERIVQVDGEVIASTRVQIPDVARMTADQAGELARLRDSQVVQVGAGNVVTDAAGTLVIQNRLDGQDISARTSLDVSLNTLQLYRDSQLGAAITAAVISAAPAP